MIPGRLNFDVDVNLAKGPVLDRTEGISPGGVLWQRDADTPASGVTPAAQRASATGAMLAAVHQASRIQQLLIAFLEHGPELTIAEAAIHLCCKEGSVCGPWNRAEHKLGWIEGTGRFYTWTDRKGRPVSREYHRLTSRGRAQADSFAAARGSR